MTRVSFPETRAALLANHHQPTRRSTLSQSRTLCIGMDVHKDSSAGASVAQDHGAEVPYLGAIGPRQCASAPLLRKLPAQATHLVCGSAAGPCGSGLSRSLTTKDSACWVGAPSLMPTKAGDRVPTDRRAAGQLARLARSGELTPGYGPTGDDAAMRDLTRAREETLSDLQDPTFRLTAFVLRQDIRSTGQATGGPAPLRGLADVVCPTPAQHMVLQEEVRAVNEHPARLQRLDQALREPGPAGRLCPVVEALQAWRGVPCTVAVTLVAAMGALTRFERPRALRKFWGLLPSESASGAPRRQGAMTTAGHTHARRVVVEGAWASRSPATGSRHWHLRLEKHPTVIQDSSGKAQVRRWKRSRRLGSRGQHAKVVTGAMARELSGVRWAMAKEGPAVASDEDGWQGDVLRSIVQLGKVRQRASAETQPRGGGTLDGVRRLVQDPRAETEAGTRRRPGRWEPTHGEPPDHPSCLPGSGSSEAQRVKNSMQT